MPIPKNFSLPIRVTAKERVLSQIRRWIIEGTLQPGEKLSDVELAETLTVSRTPVREAFQLLEVHGLVSMNPGKDTRVSDIKKDDVFKLYPPLAALHALAAEEAASLISPDQIGRLRDLNFQFKKAIETEQPYQAMELDEELHDLVITVSDNPYIASFSKSLQIHIRRFKYIFLKQPMAETFHSVIEHQSIITALENKDAQKASELMRQNVIRPMHELTNLFKGDENHE